MAQSAQTLKQGGNGDAAVSARIQNLQRLKEKLESGRLSGSHRDELSAAAALLVSKGALSDQQTGRITVERKRTLLSVEVKKDHAEITLVKGNNARFGSTVILGKDGGHTDWNPAAALGAFVQYLKRSDIANGLVETIGKMAGSANAAETQLREQPGRDSGVEASLKPVKI